MRHEPFEPMHYHNQYLMDELNEFCVALKVWLYPEKFGDKLTDLQRRYPKPAMPDIDDLHLRIHHELQKDAKPMRKH